MAKLQSAARVAGLAALFLLLVGLVAPAAGAQDEERVAVVEIELLRTSNGAAVVPLQVTVESRRAVEAELEVAVPGLNMSWRYPLALAANTEVRQVILVPTDLFELRRVEAALLSGSDELATAEVNAQAANENAVGLLGIEAPGDEVTLNPDVGKASLIELDDLRLLPGLDSLVVSPASVRALSPEEQNVLLSWVWGGKQLLVAAESGSVDEWLPAPSAEDGPHELVGAGIVRYVGRDWNDHVSPGLTVASDPSVQFDGPRGSNIELFRDGGFSVPSLRVLTIILLVYLLVAGPLTFALLSSRNKQSLTWIVLPALAVLFTTGVFVGGQFVNSGRTDAYAAVVEVNPVSGTRTETLLVSRSGRRTIELPETYSVVGTGTSGGFNEFDFDGRGLGGGGAPITQRPSRTTTELEFRIDAGSGGTVVVQGIDATMANQLVIENLALSDGELTGTVRNETSALLEEVIVMVGNRSTPVTTIAAGESIDFELSVNGGGGRFGNELRAWGVDRRNFFEFGPNNDPSEAIKTGPVNGTSWLDWRASKLGADSVEGLVTAVGWSRELDALRDGTGRTALVARANMPTTDEPLLPAQVRAFKTQVPTFNFNFAGPQSQTEVSRFVRPSGADAGNLALRFPRGSSELSVWVDDEWRWFRVDDDTGILVVIPEEAWVDDTLTARLRSDGFNPGQGDALSLAVRTDRADEVELGPPGEKIERRQRFEDEFFEGPQGGFEQSRRPLAFELADAPSEEVTVSVTDGGFIEGGYDVWELPLLAGDEVEVAMRRFGGQLDPLLVIRNPDDLTIAENDDDGNSTDSLVRFSAEADGVYEIEARPLGGGGFGEYELDVTITRPGGEADG